MSPQNTSEQIVNKLKNCKSPVICMDSRVDYDAICSCIIMRDYLVNILGKDVYITLDGKLPESMVALIKDYADISFLNQEVQPAEIDFTQFDLHIFLDSGNLNHISSDATFRPTKGLERLNIDHHAGNPLYGDLNYVKHRGSCSAVLYQLFTEAKIAINKDLASIYYLGTVLDTGFLQFDTITAADFRMIADLVEMGADRYGINWKLTFNEKLVDFRLRALVYGNFQYFPEKKYGYSTLGFEEMKSNGISPETTTFPPADMLKRIEGVNFVFVVKEKIPGEVYSFSFRSHFPDFDVSAIAKAFDGGGHKMAAGAEISADNMAEALEQVLTYLDSQKLA